MTVDACSPDARKLLDLETALTKIHAAIAPIGGTERLPLNQALGRVLANTLTCPVNIPHERNSAMDGYAFCSQDILNRSFVSLTQVGTSLAGKPFTGKLQAGECIRIFTGATLPENADSVIIQEQVTREGMQIRLPVDVHPFQNVRAIGEDLRLGDPLIVSGKKLTAADLALLAATGVQEVEVIRPLKIACCSTGDELISPGQPLTGGKIYDSNRYLLHALLQNPAYRCTDLGIIADDPGLLLKTLTEAAGQHDVIISTGGVSVGEADHIKTVLEQCGAINFWKIAIKPGKPLAFGKIGECCFFGLPGNPVAVAITFEKVVTPALQQLCGLPATQALRLQATCLSKLKKAPGRLDFQRGILKQNPQGDFEVRSAGMQGSHILSSLSQANCYIILDTACAGIAPGETVTVEPFSTGMGQ